MTTPTTPPRSGQMQDPSKIYQVWLDETSALLLDGETERFVDQVALPFVMRTTADETVFETREDLIGDMITVTQNLKNQQVTHYIRLVNKARYINHLVIEGWHTTYMLRDAIAVVPPYGSRMILRLEDNAWYLAEAEHELSNRRFPVDVVRSAPGAFQDKWAEPMSDIRATQARAEPVYQAFLDALSETVHDQDFDRWCSYFTIPHNVHYDSVDHLVNTPEDVRPFFDLLCKKMLCYGADRLTRRADYAEFISGDRIYGYHQTTMTKDGDPVFGPVKSRMILCLADGRWKCSEVTNSLSNKGFPGPEFQPSGALPTMREIQERMKK
ncbi:hypothetical protein GTA62_17750 [Roseobacter sp. HKCCD9010]|uniref:hypothetical protein n=1 Tax=Rhodobacterales TaxID=204455 RepID=UPI001491DAE9|nr:MULTISPECIES: hypothetical protein [Rhodobacterales]MBF9051851.1 hypothetical protein [Rhodobacterales bacterium HKCCD4356]NNV13844.1 hypothetical protein [Roseobacter sp. HKCCD7357]NNV17869.1 hypothetical protein [Roseobacter sp. HKCCD8768]NNV27476.1 hypothetical protein [Roseobacter sp. HKCCD8192]NNV31596.1 hypothetical protein [Roseobacter sp. HKCCD9061]